MRLLCVFLLVLCFRASAAELYDDVEQIRALAAEREVPFAVAVKAMEELATLYASKDRPLKTDEYRRLHNALFIRAHLARLKTDLSASTPSGPPWMREAALATTQEKQRMVRELTELLDESHLEKAAAGATLATLSDLNAASSDFRFSQTMSKRMGSPMLMDMRGPRRDELTAKLDELLRLNPAQLEETLERLKLRDSKSRRDSSPKVRIAPLVKAWRRPFEPSPRTDDARGFLTAVGLSPAGRPGGGVDLSASFSAPGRQGHSLACVGFAVAADLEAELKRAHALKKGEVVWPWTTYGRLRLLEEKQPLQSCAQLEAAARDMGDRAWEFDNGTLVTPALENMRSNSVCVWQPGSTYRGVRITGFANWEKGPYDLDVLRVMLDHALAPMVGISMEARTIQEDWIQIGGVSTISHILVVVGYGREAINPFTLQTERYFIVRDSLVPQARHYRVSERNLQDYANGVWKITGVTEGLL